MAHEMISTATTRDLPQAYYISMANVIVRWAHAEWRLRETLYAILKVNPKQGRLAVASPRAHEILTRIEDLMSLSNLTTSVDLKKVRCLLNDAGQIRNDLVHGIWVVHPEADRPLLQKVTGGYAPEVGAKKIKARIDPRAMSITPKEMDTLARKIDGATDAINVLKSEIEKQLSVSPEKCCRQEDAPS